MHPPGPDQIAVFYHTVKTGDVVEVEFCKQQQLIYSLSASPYCSRLRSVVHEPNSTVLEFRTVMSVSKVSDFSR